MEFVREKHMIMAEMAKDEITRVKEGKK